MTPPAAALMPFIATAAIAVPAAAQPQDFRIESEWVFETDAVHPGTTARGALQVTLADRWHVHSDRPNDEFLIPTVLAVTAPEGIEVAEIVYPEPIELDAEAISELPLSVFEHEFVIGVALAVGPGVAPGDYELDVALDYQACDDRICLMPMTETLAPTLRVVPATAQIERSRKALFDAIAWTGQRGPGAARPEVREPPDARPEPPPETPADDCDVMAELASFSVAGTAAGYMGPDDFIEFLDQAEAGTIPANPLEGKGPIAILVLVILGGLLLNLTPCVLPLVPINLAIIGAGAQAGSRLRGFALGGTYGLAMALTYGVTGLVVTLTALSFGAVNSTVWFNVLIAALFVVLALAMFDVIHIDFSKLQGKLDLANKGRRGSFALAFGMGAVSALLAGACVAPVVIQVIVYAGDQYAKGVTIALALPFCLGLGMALPWPFAGAGLSFLPRPGTWMTRVKQAMGVFILAFAAYYAYLAWEIHDSTSVDAAAVQAAVEKQLQEEGWTASICGGLETARAENRLVFIDMWATWCKNCLAMDKTTFKDPEVVARMDDYVKVKFQAEDLMASPAREMLERFESVGLPTYALLRPHSAPESVARK